MSENQTGDADQVRLVPIVYSRYRKPELQQMCRDRVPPLPASGSVPELIDRLGADDQRTGNVPMVPAPPEDDLGPAQPAADLSFMVSPDGPEDRLPVPMPEPPAPQPASPAPQTTGSGRSVSASVVRGELAWPGAFVAYYPCPTELSTDTHNRYLQRIADDAAAAGHVVRGGAHRSGWVGEGDDRKAVYEISVRKEE